MTALKLTAAVFAATLALAATSAPAQTASGPASRVNVPFAFEVGSAHFAPGVYTLRMVSEHALTITNGTRSAVMMANVDENRASVAPAGKVIFHRYGTAFFIEEVYQAGTDTHMRCVKSREAKQAEKANVVQVSMNEEQPSTLEVAVLAQAN